MDEPVCAVVVTYNRKELLAECLDGLRVQTRRVDEILVVDNASTDGTSEMLAARGYLEDPAIRHVRLPGNIGGAGGFHAGMAAAYERGHTWIWLLDDDTIVAADALYQLFAARERFATAPRPDLLASRVEWTDGTAHPMNAPIPRRVDHPAVHATQGQAVQSIRATSFVSVLLHRCLVDAYGLPIAEYFIWSDDIEYTARILRHEFGVLVPASIAVHKTPRKHSSITAEPARFYYHVRNTCWMLVSSDAWSLRERLPQFWSLALTIQSRLRHSRAKGAMLRAVLTALRDGLFARPR